MIRRYTHSRYERAQQLRQNATDAERFAWELLRGRRMLGLKFRRQHPMGRYAILDFYCPTLRLAIELDGEGHRGAGRHERDEVRDRLLASTGIRVLRVHNEDLDASHLEALIKPYASRDEINPLST